MFGERFHDELERKAGELRSELEHAGAHGAATTKHIAGPRDRHSALIKPRPPALALDGDRFTRNRVPAISAAAAGDTEYCNLPDICSLHCPKLRRKAKRAQKVYGEAGRQFRSIEYGEGSASECNRNVEQAQQESADPGDRWVSYYVSPSSDNPAG